MADQDKIVKERLRSAIRKVWSIYSTQRQEALYQAKRTKRRTNKDGTTSQRPNVVYICAECKGEHKADEIQVDHKEAVGATPDFPPKADDTQWSTWLLRLFCEADNLQILCLPCHKRKSAEERAHAAANRLAKKAKEKKRGHTLHNSTRVKRAKAKKTA